jgi:hypothetical protein
MRSAKISQAKAANTPLVLTAKQKSGMPVGSAARAKYIKDNERVKRKEVRRVCVDDAALFHLVYDARNGTAHEFQVGEAVAVYDDDFTTKFGLFLVRGVRLSRGRYETAPISQAPPTPAAELVPASANHPLLTTATTAAKAVTDLLESIKDGYPRDVAVQMEQAAAANADAIAAIAAASIPLIADNGAEADKAAAKRARHRQIVQNRRTIDRGDAANPGTWKTRFSEQTLAILIASDSGNPVLRWVNSAHCFTLDEFQRSGLPIRDFHAFDKPHPEAVHFKEPLTMEQIANALIPPDSDGHDDFTPSERDELAERLHLPRLMCWHPRRQPSHLLDFVGTPPASGCDQSLLRVSRNANRENLETPLRDVHVGAKFPSIAWLSRLGVAKHWCPGGACCRQCGLNFAFGLERLSRLPRATPNPESGRPPC